jgi:alpha-L-fucosidase
MGDWYAQKMYQPDARNNAVYPFHVREYGHPSKFGFKDVINEWQAENWEPEKLIALYKRAGAKFFAAMANHHDNTDMWDSTYQPWNTVAIGPKKDIVGGWGKAARAAGLKFALTCHGDRAWSWYQDAQKSDTTGPLKGVPYDGQMTREDGKGLWWEGLDPQDLYAQYHRLGQYGWTQSGNPPIDKQFCEKYFNRIIDLINKHNPDLLYFDDTVLPIYPASDVGLRIAAYLYNSNYAKNGNLMLNIPLRGDGTPDRDEIKVLEGLAAWIAPNGEGIYSTRPFKVYGEGPSTITQARGQFGGARDVRPYTSEDFRFTCKGETVYAFLMVWPEGGKATIKSLAQGNANFPKEVARVELLGIDGPLTFSRDASGLVVNLPDKKPGDYAYSLKITPA